MKHWLFLFSGIFLYGFVTAQLVEVRANYNSVGDVDFVAYNNTPAPLFLNIDFADLQNSSFDEPLPYMKRIEPGFNTLFTLLRQLDADVPRFHYQIKYYRSNPFSQVDLNFPYLIPLAPGENATIIDVHSIAGFRGAKEPDSWAATGFRVKPGQPVYACRSGTVVEIAGEKRITDPQTWYHAWNNSVTLLQPDGTLICYRHIDSKKEKLKINQKVFAGQPLGEVVPDSDELIIMVFQSSPDSEAYRFIIPQYVKTREETGLLISSETHTVVHPVQIRGLEMTRRERRKYLK